MAAGQENSWNLGSCLPTRFPTRENWSGGILYNALGSHFTKKHLFCPFWPLMKWKIHFLGGKSKNPSYKSCRLWKDAHLCQKWGEDSKVCYRTCANHCPNLKYNQMWLKKSVNGIRKQIEKMILSYRLKDIIFAILYSFHNYMSRWKYSKKFLLLYLGLAATADPWVQPDFGLFGGLVVADGWGPHVRAKLIGKKCPNVGRGNRTTDPQWDVAGTTPAGLPRILA
jgi:hypothetical protein